MLAKRPLMGMPLTYALCTTEKEVMDFFRRFGIKTGIEQMLNDGCNATTHFYTKDGKYFVAVYFPIRDDIHWTQAAGLLVHEAVHVFQLVCKSIGETDPSCEFEAYAIQGISQELLEIYERKVT